MEKLLNEHYNDKYKVELFDDESQISQNKTDYRYRVIVMDNNGYDVFELDWFTSKEDAIELFWKRQEYYDNKAKEIIEFDFDEIIDDVLKEKYDKNGFYFILKNYKNQNYNFEKLKKIIIDEAIKLKLSNQDFESFVENMFLYTTFFKIESHIENLDNFFNENCYNEILENLSIKISYSQVD